MKKLTLPKYDYDEYMQITARDIELYEESTMPEGRMLWWYASQMQDLLQIIKSNKLIKKDA